MNKLIIGLLIGLVLGTTLGYLVLPQVFRNDPMGNFNFQIDDNTKNEIVSFFENTQDLNEISNYCEQNMAHCMYYCREINPGHEICSQFQNMTRGPIQ